jgi:hypothetical protein
MDVFDGEPYANLMPRRLMRFMEWALLISLAFNPAARDWIMGQAEQHVIHEMQPLLDNLVDLPEPSTPAGTAV